MLHEARGLDTYLLSVQRFRKLNDIDSDSIISRNYSEEIGHVACGVRWFKYLCERENKDPVPTFHQLVLSVQFGGRPKGPFNVEARRLAGLTEEWYLPLCMDTQLQNESEN